MEFMYRAGENKPSPPPPQRTPLEALQRELEEERIKEEILLRRLNQKRMLEELEMARALDLRPVLRSQPLISRNAIQFHAPIENRNQNTAAAALERKGMEGALDIRPVLRFQPSIARHAFEFDAPIENRNRSKAARMGMEGALDFRPVLQSQPSIARNPIKNKKRKTAAAALESAGGERRLRQARKEWNCALCMVSATSEEGLRSHLEGKKHMEKAAELGHGKVVKPKEEQEPKPSGRTGKKLVRVVVDGRTEWAVERGNSLVCDRCGVKCHGKDMMVSHLSGKKHMKYIDAGM